MSDDQPFLNRSMEDYLAHGGGSREADVFLIRSWIMLGFEYLARAEGRSGAAAHADRMAEWVREANPATPWAE